MDQEPMIGAAVADAHGTNCEAAVLERYGKAAQEVEACLCLPVSYDRGLLKVIPAEIREKDYGCGDPSRYIRAGETVLDLGSGSAGPQVPRLHRQHRRIEVHADDFTAGADNLGHDVAGLAGCS